jgi:NhaP-type Na+/H+ or K+/H+ antiporter
VTATIQTLLLLIAVLVVVAVVARRFHTAPSILLVIAGIGLALIPGLPRIEPAPELVLFGILPPLIYSAGVAMSWREFRFNLRPITLLAVGCVVFTTCAVAAVAHWLLGMPLAVGFVLGAIVSPPMRLRRSPSFVGWAFRAGSSSCLKVKASPMTQPP